MAELLFVDTETTGLDPKRHEIWELAWCSYPGGAVVSKRLNPLLRFHEADSTALRLNGFYSRHETGVYHETGRANEGRQEVLAHFALESAGKYLAGFNPAFDALRLDNALREAGFAPAWHHRLVDLEAMAMGLLQWDEPRGAIEIAKFLEIVHPIEHTAIGDVRLAYRVYEKLRKLGERVG